MAAPKQIIELIDRFDRNRDAYQSGQYNETQLRREFLDPLFESLGWDIHNKQGYAEAYKDVIHEDAIKIGAATKAPDYCFRIGGTRKFFVEAKKPSINVKEDISPAFQLRRYSWSAKLPLSILTDFEEFAVYDCRIKPVKTDNASTARIKYLTFSDYLQNWDELVSIFSRESVLKGSFDKYIESTKIKKGTAEVDDAFLTEIELWRELLAKNIAIRNPQLTQRELNFAVQRTIDRLIFLRICEDRGIETYGRLMALQNSDRVYPQLCEIFHRADERYNSGLFHFSKEKDRAESPDELSLSLAIDDKPLKEIIKNLYYPDSAYEFSVLPADILGQVYEQFLGKVIRLTAGHHAVVEDKPEVKKAGGVYYTPTYIVDYIVKNTVGKLLENKTPKSVAQLRILDPACGSGSFLINAYQLLLDWHRDYYINEGITKHKKELYQVAGGDYRLTTAERKRILLNNIYGVDIDPQAVEVTKLSLLLKVLEGENEQTISNQLRLFHERALPDLGNNIKCGNSLIGPDFYDNQQLSLLDDDERYRINVFDWDKEFPEIFLKTTQSRRDSKNTENAGFDAVIGNPPYINAINLVDLYSEQREYLDNSKHYITLFQKWDLYIAFIEKGLNLIKANIGLYSMIIPYPYINQLYAQKSREWIANNFSILNIVDLYEWKIFADAVVKNCIIIVRNQKASKNQINIVKMEQNNNFYIESTVMQHKLPQGKTSIWNIEKHKALSFSDNKFLQFGDVCFISIGMVLNADEFKAKGQFKKKDLISKTPSTIHIKKYVEGKDVERYKTPGYQWLEWNTKRVPNLIRRPTFPELYECPKILINKLGEIKATIDKDNLYCEQTIRVAVLFKHLRNVDNKSISNSIQKYYRFERKVLEEYSEGYNYEYLLGFLNSKLANYLLDQIRGRDNIDINPDYLKQLPIRTINFSNPKGKSKHDRMVELVDRMLTLHKQLALAKTPDEQTNIQRQIDATDHQIDRLVYELYGLTEEEINIIEKRV